jgi:hypothetical protein
MFQFILIRRNKECRGEKDEDVKGNRKGVKCGRLCIDVKSDEKERKE